MSFLYVTVAAQRAATCSVISIALLVLTLILVLVLVLILILVLIVVLILVLVLFLLHALFSCICIFPLFEGSGKVCPDQPGFIQRSLLALQAC